MGFISNSENPINEETSNGKPIRSPKHTVNKDESIL